MYEMKALAISVMNFAAPGPLGEVEIMFGCAFRTLRTRSIASWRFSSSVYFVLIIFPSLGKKLLVALREYSQGRGFSTQTPLAFLIFSTGGSSEEDPCLPHGVGIADAHRHSRDGRPCGHIADDRKRHAARPHDGSKGIDAGGKCCALPSIQSAYLHADSRVPLDCWYFSRQNDHLYPRRYGHTGHPYGFRACHHCKPSEIRHQGSDASASSRSGQFRLVFQARD